MAILPLQLARVSNLLRTNVANQTISRTQQSLLEVQNQLSSGKRLNAPSDDPGAAAIVQQLHKTLEQRAAYSTNLKQGIDQLSEVDSTLGDITNLLEQAQSIASANVGSDVTNAQRQSAAAVVGSLYSQMLTLANKQFQGVYIFGGDRSTQAPFLDTLGGVKFVGSANSLQNVYDENTILPFMANGERIFGALSTRVQGTADLTPRLSANTRLVDLAGTSGEGVRRGSIEIGNGTTTRIIDLSGADTLGDVVAAIDAAGMGITATLTGQSLTLTPAGTENITVREVGGGSLASDLGILQATGAGAGVALAGGSVQPRLTALTPLADLRNGVGIDLASGLTITNGQASATVRFTSPPLPAQPTMQDLLNAINGSGTNVRAEINAAGTGINLLNPSQGTQLTIAENGGTTASDLGVRSFHLNTPLGELNFGAGVRAVAGDDMRIIRRDGTSFTVDLSSAKTVQDVIDLINTADGGAGVSAAFATTGNGITLTDSTGGAGTLSVTPLNFSQAAADLGLLANPPSGGGNVIQGADVNAVKPQGIFSNLGKLRAALQSGDQATITAAADGLKADYDRVVQIRGETGARVQEMESRQDRLEDENLASKALLSSLEDTDFTEAVSRFQTLQQSLQASMMSSARLLDLTLLDFLG